MSNSAKKICLLGFEPTNPNLGVRALTAGTIACIFHQYPEAEISLLDYAKKGGVVPFRVRNQMVRLRLVNVRFSKRLLSEDHIIRLLVVAMLSRLMPTEGLRRALTDRNPRLRHIHGMDFVAAISGGDSFSDIYGLPRFLYVSLPQLLAVWMGKRLVLLPQTIGPFRTRVARAISRYILRKADTVYSRDRQGLESAAALLGPNRDGGKLRFCYDVAFALEPAAPASVDLLGLPAGKADGACRVGVNVSGLLSMGGYNRQNMFGLRGYYSDLIRSVIKLLIERKNTTVLLVPHVFGSGAECDSPACEKVYAELKAQYAGRLGLLSGHYNHSEIKSVIGQCDFFIGSRMHACIAAVSQCVPTVSIAYSDKFIGVMETLGADLLVADPRKMDEDEILNVVDHAFERRETTRQQLEHKIPEVKQRVLSLFDETPAAEDSPDARAVVPVSER